MMTRKKYRPQRDASIMEPNQCESASASASASDAEVQVHARAQVHAHAVHAKSPVSPVSHSDDEGNVIIELDTASVFVPIPETDIEPADPPEHAPEPAPEPAEPAPAEPAPELLEPALELLEPAEPAEPAPALLEPAPANTAEPAPVSRWERFKTSWLCCCCARHRKRRTSTQLKDEPSPSHK